MPKRTQSGRGNHTFEKQIERLEQRIKEIETRRRFSPEVIRAERQRLGLSQTAYAELIGVSLLTLGFWERAVVRPRRQHLKTLEEVFGISKKEAYEYLGMELPPPPFDGSLIKRERERLELSAADYAELVGVYMLTIYNWENGKTQPKREHLEMLKAVKGISKREAWRRLGY